MFEFIFNSTHTDGLRRKMTAFRDICDPKNEKKNQSGIQNVLRYGFQSWKPVIKYVFNNTDC